MMKIKGMDTPRNILFSGTGSKTLNILDSDRDLGSLTKLFEVRLKKQQEYQKQQQQDK